MAWWTVCLEETTAPSKTLMTSLNGLRPPLAFRWVDCFTRLDNSTDTLPPDARAWRRGPGGAGRVSHRGDQLPLAGGPPQLRPGGVRIQPFRWEYSLTIIFHLTQPLPQMRRSPWSRIVPSLGFSSSESTAWRDNFRSRFIPSRTYLKISNFKPIWLLEFIKQTYFRIKLYFHK